MIKERQFVVKVNFQVLEFYFEEAKYFSFAYKKGIKIDRFNDRVIFSKVAGHSLEILFEIFTNEASTQELDKFLKNIKKHEYFQSPLNFEFSTEIRDSLLNKKDTVPDL